MQYRLLRDQWFLAGALLVVAFGLWNPWGWVEPVAGALRRVHGNEAAIVLIFICSGLELEWEHMRNAVRDRAATFLVLAAIFLLAPALAWLVSRATSSEEIRLGLFLVGTVPTTLATGAVMCAVAGGRVAHAVLVTILSYLLCVFTIPPTLSLMLAKSDFKMVLPCSEMMVKLACLVVIPLGVAMLLNRPLSGILKKIPFRLNVFTRCIVLVILFLGLAGGRESILRSGAQVMTALGLVILLHLLLAGILWGVMRRAGWGPGRRESVFFQGIQKTLPLSIWLQATYFGACGMALAVCVLHHVTQLVLDSYFAERMSQPHPQPNKPKPNSVTRFS